MDPPDSGNPFITRRSLLLRLREDGPEREIAWQDFYEQYAPIIGGFCRKMGARPADIPDLVQDVLLGFFAASPMFVYDPSRGRFRGYLKTCVWRLFQRRIGKELRLGGRPIQQVDPADVQVEVTWNDVWETDKVHRALEIVRNRYMARPDKSRTFQAFEMYALLERSAEDVAAELTMTVESVHQAKYRVSKAVKVAMDQLDTG